MDPSLIQRVAKPAYIYRPQQLLQRRRVRGAARPVVTLPWGLSLEVFASESIGSGIARTGVHELPVTEAMFRLLAPGDFAVDVGANVGYFTSLMAYRAGVNGSVLAFEPHPMIGSVLERNATRWNHRHVTIDRRAVSNVSGTARLSVPTDFAYNMGTSALDGSGDVAVETVPLDERLNDRSVALLKLDVEGHELSVLDGARAALSARRIRHVMFEEHEPLPTAVSTRLEEAGFTIFALRERFRGVELALPSDPTARPKWDAPTYLATLSPDSAAHCVRADGWRSLRPR